jgi:hypothetical protein
LSDKRLFGKCAIFKTVHSTDIWNIWIIDYLYTVYYIHYLYKLYRIVVWILFQKLKI